MIQKLIAGFVGGIVYILCVWAATLTGILEWLDYLSSSHPMEAFSIFAPFSLMAIFMFATIYLYHQWQPQERTSKTFGKLMIIGFSFALGATTMQLTLMQLDGIAINNALIITGLFLGTSLLISLLICSFYLFIKPLKSNKKT